MNILDGKFLSRATLNKPKVLNSLDLDMITILQKAAKNWSASQVKAVWLEGVGEKAFCAGGDIKTLYLAKKSGNPEEQKVLD